MDFHRVSMRLFALTVLVAMLAACGLMTLPTEVVPTIPVATQTPTSTPAPTVTAVPPTAAPTATTTPVKPKPDWFNIQMTNVRTDQTFSINDFSGKVVLIQTMEEWSVNSVRQQIEIKKLEALEGNSSKDLVLISLDTSLREDATSLKEYADSLGFDWYFAISPLEVDHALSNLYDAEYMNPPLAPMLIIDRRGVVYGLPFGQVKDANALQKTLVPYLVGVVGVPASFISY